MILFVTIAAVLVVFACVLFLRARYRQASLNPIEDKPINPEQIYVGNLHFKVREGDLRNFFNRFGQIQDLYIVKNRQNGRSKGFGFVTFDNPDDADNALAAHGEMMSGRNLVVRIARQK